MKVENLFHHHHRAWNREKIIKMFPPHITVEMLKLLIPTEAQEDHQIWEHERNEKYNVRSVYWMCQK